MTGSVTAECRSPWRREMLDEKASELAAVFERHGVIAAYVFGSLAKGRDPRRVTARSDLDLALLLPDAWTRDERFRAATLVEIDLAKLLAAGPMDILVANDMPIVLRHSVIRERDLIYGADRPERTAFDWCTTREYLDTKPLRQARYSAMLRRAREGRFGVRPGTAP